VTGVRHSWVFDKFYSAMALQGLDLDNDGTYSAEELKPLAAVNISSLKDFDYFTFVKAEAQDIGLSEPLDYVVQEKDGIVTLHFSLNFAAPVDARLGALSLDVYDPSFYVAFSFAPKEAISFAGNAPKGCAATVPPQRDTSMMDLSEAFLSELGGDAGAEYSQGAKIQCAG
jgi:ABC-type uncharacterized transport system substrate-binding protein